MKKIGICCDHAGFELKEYVRGWLEAKGWEYKDFGTYSTDSCDYPDFAHPLALAVEAGECYPGIAICGSGNGISMTLNKHQGIRAALCWTAEIAHMARLHNDANVLVMPGRYISTEEADMIMTEFFSTEFEGGRHQKRIDKYIKVAVYYGLYISHLDSGAVILYQSIGLEYVGTYLAAPFYLLHLALYLSHVLKALPLGQLQQLALQYSHSHVPVSYTHLTLPTT